ncbi:MAG: 4a-hydroxytetrahydrobiopterin dehydratase [Myxococcota bacterium]
MSVRPLKERRCEACDEKTPPIDGPTTALLLPEIPGFHLERGRLEKSYNFPDFVSALHFVNRVAAIAEEEGHHPDIHLAWGKVRLEIFTHAIGALSINDFILAAKADAAYVG